MDLYCCIAVVTVWAHPWDIIRLIAIMHDIMVVQENTEQTY